jgi:hypothetical protein
MTEIHYSFISLINDAVEEGEKCYKKENQLLKGGKNITCQQKGHKVVRYIISMGQGRHTHAH